MKGESVGGGLSVTVLPIVNLVRSAGLAGPGRAADFKTECRRSTIKKHSWFGITTTANG